MEEKLTSGQLIDALKAGKTLVRVKNADVGMQQELEYENGCLFCYGWGSALGLPEDRLKYIVKNPESWSVKKE